jgi:hypothetical protein
MKMRIFLSISFMFFMPVLIFSQCQKTIRNKQLASKTVYEYFVEEGIKDPVIETIEVFDVEGNVVELKEFNSDGDIKNWQTFKFDVDDNKIEELILDEKGKVLERITWAYKDDLVVEKKYFDKKNRLFKRKEYKYEYRLD